jgi:hypothetical protein
MNYAYLRCSDVLYLIPIPGITGLIIPNPRDWSQLGVFIYKVEVDQVVEFIEANCNCGSS